MRTAVPLLAILLLGAAFAQAKLPLEFSTDPGFRPMPSYLGNPTAKPELSAADGAVTLRVAEPGKGMKFLLDLQRYDCGALPYLLLRYRAENLAGGYTIHLFDDSQAGLMVLANSELKCDGQWHELAVDLSARGAVGSVRGFATEVQCAGPPAYLSFDRLAATDELPEGVPVVPAQPEVDREQVVRGVDLKPEARPGWLAARAPIFSAQVEEGVLHLSARGTDQGMKFATPLPEALDLGAFSWAAVRYRARGLAPWGDYAFWFGSAPGGLPDDFFTLLSLSQVKADDQWHVAIVPLTKRFKVAELALEVSSAAGQGDLWLDSIRFCTRRPLLDVADVLPFTAGWSGLRLPERGFSTGTLSGQANATVAPRLRALGLKSWLPAGKVTVRGIPFIITPDKKDALSTPLLPGQGAEVLCHNRGSELYLLLLSRLPSMDGARMGDPVPMDSFRNPERFLLRVAYEDGVVDEVFPVAVGSGQYEVIRGPEVYCLPGLRPVALKSVTLVNRMDSGNVLLAGLTLNQGKAVTPVPGVQELPPSPRPVLMAMPVPAVGVRPVAGGYFFQTHSLCLDLQTAGGIAVRRLGSPYGTLVKLRVAPGPLFLLGSGKQQADSTQVVVGTPRLEGRTLTVPVDGSARGVPLKGNLVVTATDDDILMRLDLANAASELITPRVHFPLLREARVGEAADTWYLYTRKGGLLSNRPTHQRKAYGGEHPLQVDDLFNPVTGGGLAILTYDRADVYRFYDLEKGERGVNYAIEYWEQELPPGAEVETVPTALRGHLGDWREAFALYRAWVKTWYKPQVPRKAWFQNVFYYQQSTAWGPLRDQASGEWKMDEFIARCKESLGCLDYLHIFDFGESRVYGRVGDYNHYEELGGLPAMRAAVKRAQDQGVRLGLYIEGYLCDDRGLYGKDNCSKYDLRKQDGTPLLWPGAPHEHMMCPATEGWREHQAETYKRVAAELQPDGMYIDQYGFTDTWKTCWSREHGHPVPMAPLRGEGQTTQAIRAALPEGLANLTEETPNDVHAQYQDGALGYSVTFNDPVLAPHRVDLFRFAFPDFKVLQLTCYNSFVEGGWDLLKWPFFNAEAWWLGGDPHNAYSDEARAFLKQAFAILHRYAEAFTSSEVSPLVPTLRGTVYANEFRGRQVTVWTLFNADYRTFRGDLLRVPHVAGTVYRNAFSGQEITPRLEKGHATLAVTVGPRDVGCVVAERK